MVAIATMITACNTPQKNDIRKEAALTLQDGDLLVLCLAKGFSIADDSATVDSVMAPLRRAAGIGCDSIWQGLPARMHANLASKIVGSKTMTAIHVSIIDHEGSNDYIIDATLKRGVGRYPLEDFLTDYSLPDGELPVIYIIRPDDSVMASLAISNAKPHIGKSFDINFDESDSTLYCSELVQRCYNADGKHGLEPYYATTPLDFSDGDTIVPLYWREIFALINKEIPHGIPGLLPIDIYRKHYER